MPQSVIPDVLREVKFKENPDIRAGDPLVTHSEDVLIVESALSQLGLCAIRAARAVHDALLKSPSPFSGTPAAAD